MEYLSRQRYDEIADELNYLITVVYPEIRENVAETSAQGDRSENAGYRNYSFYNLITLSDKKLQNRTSVNRDNRSSDI